MAGLEFKTTKVIKGHGLTLPLGTRIQAARGVPQAVVKVCGYRHGVQGVGASMDYISRKGELALETETGEIIVGRAERKELVKNWSRDFDGWERSRDAVHLAFSMPEGSDPEKLKGAVRTVLSSYFDGHEAVFAIHQDRPHPHAHVIIKMRNRKKDKKLRLGIFEIFQVREAFAKAACEQGIELAASPRAARGVGKKGTKQAIYYLKKRGIKPEVEKQAFEEALNDYSRGWSTADHPWESAMRERNEKERKAYRDEAALLRAEAFPMQDQTMRQRLIEAAIYLERFSEEMPKPKTRRQKLLEWIFKQVNKQPPQRNQSRGEEMER